ncbi:MAG: electron transfer flavoprotein subunit alpha/FixB family protein [Thermoprotei archaeon]|nr:electron transfer flavoprotein subunit alpha/FixB family protein [Thermoprotei archaeon]
MALNMWVFIEQDEGVIEESSLGILSKAREVAEEGGGHVTGVLLGSNVAGEAPRLGRYGAHRVIVVDDPLLAYYHSEAYTRVMEGLIRERNPDILLASATRNGRDLLGRLAVVFNTGLQAHVIHFEVDGEGSLVGHVPGFGGNIVAVVKNVKGRPQMATVALGVFRAQELWGEAEVEVLRGRLDPSKFKVRRVEVVRRETIDISKSKRVVVAGMGTGGDLKLVGELAKILGADIGVTRPLADIGVAPRDLQIGSTGVSLKADLAVVLGASGAPHFVSGIRDVKTVIAINKDPEAPMLEYSDYYAVGDLFEIIPKLIEKLKG